MVWGARTVAAGRLSHRAQVTAAPRRPCRPSGPRAAQWADCSPGCIHRPRLLSCGGPRPKANQDHAAVDCIGGSRMRLGSAADGCVNNVSAPGRFDRFTFLEEKTP